MFDKKAMSARVLVGFLSKATRPLHEALKTANAAH